MPAAKKAGSARRSAKTTTDESGVKLNKDGTPRKKPGPKPGSTRSTASASKPGPKPGAKRRGRPPGSGSARNKKKFLLYAVDGFELSFICESDGATGQIAVTNAVKAGTVAPDTPIVPLAPRAVQRVIEIEAVERDVQYKVKTTATKRKYTRRKVADEPTPEPEAETPSAPAQTSVRKSARKSAPTPPAPGEKSANPFA